jgi:hypothetical protein
MRIVPIPAFAARRGLAHGDVVDVDLSDAIAPPERPLVNEPLFVS